MCKNLFIIYIVKEINACSLTNLFDYVNNKEVFVQDSSKQMKLEHKFSLCRTTLLYRASSKISFMSIKIFFSPSPDRCNLPHNWRQLLLPKTIQHHQGSTRSHWEFHQLYRPGIQYHNSLRASSWEYDWAYEWGDDRDYWNQGWNPKFNKEWDSSKSLRHIRERGSSNSPSTQLVNPNHNQKTVHWKY